ncbi:MULTISPECIES: hypothetical protein [Brevundimonas]|uniref:hypothetical protein n=1 Tax=Brevundimonas TaxID=41275 RepID=UPI000F032737|nr:hypothetical protein [Brevundimonas lutea]
MRGLMILGGGALTLAGCAAPYEAAPNSPYQWERQQEKQRRDYCHTLEPDSPAYRRDCGRAGDRS